MKKLYISFIAILFLSIIANPCYAQFDYKKTEVVGPIKITVLEKGRDSNSLLNNAFVNVEVDNNVIEKKIDIGGDYIDSSFIRDYDDDNNPEIIIIARSTGSGGYGQLLFYELEGGNLLFKKFPEINLSLIDFYMGHDSFLVTKEEIVREFPAYLPNDANCCPKGGACKVYYTYMFDNIVEKSFEHIPPEGQKGFDLIIKTAVGLPKMDTFSNTDCFIEIYMGDNFIGRTKTVQNDNTPYFNERISFPIYNGEPIKFVLSDEDVSKIRSIGKVVLSKPISGKYPIQTETIDGSIISNGELDIEFISESK
jgi:hypothetical protein